MAIDRVNNLNLNNKLFTTTSLNNDNKNIGTINLTDPPSLSEDTKKYYENLGGGNYSCSVEYDENLGEYVLKIKIINNKTDEEYQETKKTKIGRFTITTYPTKTRKREINLADIKEYFGIKENVLISEYGKIRFGNKKLFNDRRNDSKNNTPEHRQEECDGGKYLWDKLILENDDIITVPLKEIPIKDDNKINSKIFKK